MTLDGPRSGRGLRLGIAVALIACALVVLYLWTSGSKPAAEVDVAGAPVSSETVRLRDVPITLEANGTVTSLAVAPVKPRIDGQLVSLAFREGQYVRRGQVLAIIDDRAYRAELARAEATVRKDRALAADFKVNEGRAHQLAMLGAGPEQNADTLRAQAQAASATADADAAQAAIARLNLGFTRVTAPIDGRVGLRQVDVGSIVRTADPLPLVTVTQMSPISVLFSVPQSYLPDLHDAESRGAVTVSAIVEDRIVATGTLAAIDSTVDPLNGQVKLRANFANMTRSLWPGELVAVRIALRVLPGVPTVSDSAVLNGPNGNYAYVIDARSRAMFRTIAIGPSVDGLTVVTRGLKQGERVVTSGQLRLKPGARVTVQQSRK